MIILQDILTKKKLVATPTQCGGGGYDIIVSPSSFLYSHLKDDPKKLIGRVFQIVKKVDHEFQLQQKFVKITREIHLWIKPSKSTQLPDLKYQAVLFEDMETPLEAIEEIAKYNEKEN